jgi:hypothetical protein
LIFIVYIRIFQGALRREVGMDQNSIKRWQAKKIHEAMHPSMNYLLRLRKRMEKKGFPPSDPYY